MSRRRSSKENSRVTDLPSARPGHYWEEAPSEINLSDISGYKDIGEKAEALSFELFASIVGNENVFPEVFIYEPDNNGYPQRKEVCDGIIRYGETLFLLQTKAKDPKEGKGVTSSWVEKKSKKASSQLKTTRVYLERNPILTLEDRTGQSSTIRVEDYNLVTVLLLVAEDVTGVHDFSRHNRLRLNDKEQVNKVPLIRTTLNELLTIQKLLHEEEYFKIAEYLRIIQYQMDHLLGDDIRRFKEYFGSFLRLINGADPVEITQNVMEAITGLPYRAGDVDYLSMGSHILATDHSNFGLDHHATKKILGMVDYYLPQQRDSLNAYLNSKNNALYTLVVEGRLNTAYVFVRYTATEPIHTFKSCKEQAQEDVEARLDTYEELKALSPYATVIVVYYMNLVGKVRCHIIVSDADGILDGEYDVEKDLPSLQHLVAQGKIQMDDFAVNTFRKDS